jgi:hypothetical protein
MVQTCVVTVTETICGNLSGSSTLTVTINPTPTPSAPDVNICIGGTASLTATGGGGSTFTWFSANGNSVGTGNPITVNSPGNYYVEETDVNGCKAKDYLLVTAYPQPIAGIMHCLLPVAILMETSLPTFSYRPLAEEDMLSHGQVPALWDLQYRILSQFLQRNNSVLVTEPVHGCTKLATPSFAYLQIPANCLPALVLLEVLLLLKMVLIAITTRLPQFCLSHYYLEFRRWVFGSGPSVIINIPHPVCTCLLFKQVYWLLLEYFHLFTIQFLPLPTSRQP